MLRIGHPELKVQGPVQKTPESYWTKYTQKYMPVLA